MALYDAWQVADGFSFDELARRLTTRWLVRAPRTLALQAPDLPARGDQATFQGEALQVRSRRIVDLPRTAGADNEAGALTAVEVVYEPPIDTFSGGSPINPDDPDVRLIRGSVEAYDIEIPTHVFEVVSVVNAQGNTEVFAVFTPQPSVYEGTLERVTLEMNIELFGPDERALIKAQRGKLHQIEGTEPTALFVGAQYQQIGGNLTKVFFQWEVLDPVRLDPTPVQNVYKPGDGPGDETPLPPFARWVAIPGPEVGEGPTLRRAAPTFKVFGRRETGDPALLPGNPAFSLLNGTANGGL